MFSIIRKSNCLEKKNKGWERFRKKGKKHMDQYSEKKEKRVAFGRNHILVFSMMFFLFGLSFLCWFKKEEDFSESERRMLEKFPQITMKTIMNGEFMEDFEKYSLDQFPMRDEFRGIKALISYGIFQKRDNNGIYVVDGFLSKLEYPMQKKMLDHAAMRLEEIYDMYLKEKGSRCYFSIVPDKNYFLAEENNYLSMNYEELFSYMKQQMEFAEYIDITTLLSIEDYYSTDTHWRQEKIVDVAEYLKEAMRDENNRSANDNDELQQGAYEVKEYSKPFYGVYYGQSALPVKPDTLYYLENDVLRQCKVTSYDTGKAKESVIYNMEKADGIDAYELFLSGTSALQVIENPSAKEKRELIVFRDSFGSSLVPLLVDEYSKITVVDTRYVQSKVLGNLIEFQGQDVLFIYSTMILNNSMSLR